RKENGSIVLRPGISGYAQIHGRGVVDPVTKGEMDGYYFEHFSFWLDIKIFVLTVLSVFGFRKKQK
ncbi:MAG: sugar transferase, partial [Acholeplasmataceae bacterium]